MLTIFNVRAYKPFYLSRPAKLPVVSALAGGLLAIGLPYNPMAVSPGLAPLPLPILVAVLSISLL
ncbi:Mg2+-importing ATPase [Pseudomonas migulae]|uniref:Mg2+-importing ATPase n=1 Tax=Pseudomonas migulae TaxID=78543 RepID=A0A1H5KAZ2_9PSED|nr:Mg2+-importing ATPase [Pseudomonas migulae]